MSDQERIGKLLSRFVAARISIGSARKSFTDKTGTLDFCSSNGVDEKQARVVINLFVKSDIDRINSLLTAMRTYFQSNSFPTEQSGVRLVSVDKFQAVLDRMDEYSLSLAHEIDRLKQNWDHVIENSRMALGSKFDEKRYPDKEDIEEIFYARIRLEPHPNMNVICDEVTTVVSDVVRERMLETKKENELIVQAVLSDIAQQITDTIIHVENRCQDIIDGKAKRVHGSMFSNISKICESIADSLGNTELTMRVRELQTKLSSLSNINPDYVKDAPEKAEAVRDCAKEAIKVVKRDILSAL